LARPTTPGPRRTSEHDVGTSGPQDFVKSPDAASTRFFEINVTSGVRLSRAYLSGMVDRDCGPIVLLSSGFRLSSEPALNIPADRFAAH
jgi:short-subunit dehydrogenase